MKRILAALGILQLSFLAACSCLPPEGSHVVDKSWPKWVADLPWEATTGLSVDGMDNIWVVTRANPTMRMYNPAGDLLKSWGDTEMHKRAHHVRIDPEGHLWLADLLRHTIQKYTTDGEVLLTLGTDGVSGEDESHFFKPSDMVITPKGDIFVSDGYGNSRIVHFDKNGKFIKAWGKFGTKPGEFNQPHAIDIDSKGRIYVADRNNGRIQIFEQSGKFVAEWRGHVIPWGIWITKKDEIWVCGSANYPVKPPPDQVFIKFNRDGKVLDRFEVPVGHNPGETDWIHAMTVDSKGNIFCGDVRGNRAQKFVPKKKK